MLPDFLMTQVPVFAMSWEAVWCTEIHGTVPKVVPACTGGTWVPYMAYFGLPDFEFAARYSLRLKVYCKLDPKAPEQFLVLITMFDGDLDDTGF